MDTETLIYAASVIYNLWFARNKFIFEGIYKTEEEIIVLISRCIHDYQTCNAINNKAEMMKTSHVSNSHHCHNLRKAKWRKPEANLYKINTDANLSEANAWGLGVIVRDDAGEVFTAATWKMDCFDDLAAAEAFGIYLAMAFAADCGFLDVIFETNCERVVRFLSDKEPVPNLYVGNVIRGIRNTTNRFRHVSFNFVGRKGNEVAHKLAQHALIEPNKAWIEETSACVVSEVLRDIFNQ